MTNLDNLRALQRARQEARTAAAAHWRSLRNDLEAGFSAAISLVENDLTKTANAAGLDFTVTCHSAKFRAYVSGRGAAVRGGITASRTRLILMSVIGISSIRMDLLRFDACANEDQTWTLQAWDDEWRSFDTKTPALWLPLRIAGDSWYCDVWWRGQDDHAKFVTKILNGLSGAQRGELRLLTFDEDHARRYSGGCCIIPAVAICSFAVYYVLSLAFNS